MRFGVTMFATDQSMNVVDLACESEARGFESLYLPEHTHIPVERRTPPPTGEAELAEEYKRTLDPFVALAAAATATDAIRLGTGIALPAQREPIVTAKAVATLDQLSEGRFVFGIGFGWNEDELEDHGVRMKDRRDIVREHVMAMKSLWSEDVGSYEGRFTHVSPSWSWPKPTQRPHPPILIGGAAGPKLFAHIAEYADGWIPIGGAGLTTALPELREVVARSGRDPRTLQVVPFGSIPDHGKLDHFAEIGVTECVFRLPSRSRDAVLPVLDKWAALLAER
jgi:probable F420-dependent oxidoreductase